MVTPKWFVEKTKFNDSTKKIIKEVRKQKMLVKQTDYIPFVRDKSYLSLFNQRDCVVFYGTINFALQVQREAPWIPGVYLDKEKTNCQYYYPLFGDHLLNHDYIMLPFGDLISKKEQLFSMFGGDEIFIRPDSGLKSFTGKVSLYESFNKDVEKFTLNNDVTPQTMVVVAKAANIKYEWRLVVSNHVIAGSRYQIGKTLTLQDDVVLPKGVIDYAESVLLEVDYKPNPVWILDICETSEGLKVLEVGSFSVAGLYNSNIPDIVSEVSKLAQKEYEEYYER